MITSFGRMIGLPVVLGDREVGRVERAVPDADVRALGGLVVRRGIGGAKWVTADAIELVGQRCVMVRMRPSHAPKEDAARSTAALNTSGERLGEVTDALMRGDTLRVIALEVSRGPLYRIMGDSAYASSYAARRESQAVVVHSLVSLAELQRTLGEGEDEWAW